MKLILLLLATTPFFVSAKENLYEKVKFSMIVWNENNEKHYETKEIDDVIGKKIENKNLGVTCKITKEIRGAKPRRVAILASKCALNVKDGMDLLTEVTCPIDFTKSYLGAVPFNLISKDQKHRLAIQLTCEFNP